MGQEQKVDAQAAHSALISWFPVAASVESHSREKQVATEDKNGCDSHTQGRSCLSMIVQMSAFVPPPRESGGNREVYIHASAPDRLRCHRPAVRDARRHVALRGGASHKQHKPHQQRVSPHFSFFFQFAYCVWFSKRVSPTPGLSWS